MTKSYNTALFTDIWDTAEKFKNDLNASVFSEVLNADSKDILYYLLLSKYANNAIANLDINQFKNKVFAIIFQFGPTWEKRLELQKNLRGLTEEELLMGSKTINNHAFNPSTDPGTSALEELNYIDNQQTVNSKRSKMEAYALLMNLLVEDVTGEFLERFKPCFKVFVKNERPLLYEYDAEDF